MTKIIFLGTAASISSKKRDSTSFVFIHSKEILLIDCPGSIIQKLDNVNIDFRKIVKIILTHHHPDHIYGIFHLIHAKAYVNKKIHIFTNQYTAGIIKKIVTILKLDRKHFPKINYIDVFKKDFFYTSKNLKLKPVKNRHAYQSFGIKFIFNKKSLLYSSDTAPSENILKEAKNSTYLIHDCTASSYFFKKNPNLYTMHTDSSTLAQYFKTISCKKIIPIHFLPLGPAEEKRIKKELKIFKQKLIIPNDFQKLNLT